MTELSSSYPKEQNSLRATDMLTLQWEAEKKFLSPGENQFLHDYFLDQILNIDINNPITIE